MFARHVMRLLVFALLAFGGQLGVATAHEHTDRHTHARAPAFPGETGFSLIWYQDLVYDETSPDPIRTSLDMYVPDPQPTGAPVVVFMHGGGFRGSDKAWYKDLGEMPIWFTQEMGYVFVSMNYRFLPEGRYPVKEQDAANAIAWLSDNVAPYGGDPEKIIVLGHAPGTYLASIVATDGSFLENAGKDLGVLRGAIVVDDAYYDVTGRVGDQAFPADADGLRRASPIHNVSAGKGIPPFLLLHAGRPEYREQADAMGAALTEAGVSNEVVEVQGKTHLTIIGDLGRPQDPVTLIVQHFLDSLDLD
jgi:acetyl esterase/lipase